MGLPPSDVVKDMFKASLAYQTRPETLPIDAHMKIIAVMDYKYVSVGGEKKREMETSFRRPRPDCLPANWKWKRFEGCTWGEARPPAKGVQISQTELSADKMANDLPKGSFDMNPEDEYLSHPAPKDAPLVLKDVGSKATMARAGGALKTFMAVGKDVLPALGIVSGIAGAVFVIIDFVDHN